jgi:hypothetical protein
MRNSIALLLLLAGCSTAQWQKPGTTQETVDADFRSCSASAEAVPALAALRTTSTSVEVRPAPAGGIGVQTAGAYGDADQRLQQGQRVQDCMRQKGYTLRPG